MKRFFIIVLSMFSVIQLSAQTETDTTKVKNWNLGGSVGFNFNQTSLKNWSAGGDDILGGTFLLDGKLDYKKDHWLWQNAMIVEYGLTRTSSDGYTKKASDRLELSTKLGYTTDNIWYYTGMADFKTQFYKGYNYPDRTTYISKFMAPAYSTVSVGIEYKPEGKFYSVYFSPLAGKFTFVRDDKLSEEGAFGVDPGDKFKAELGAYLKAKAEKEVMENVKISTDVNFFTAYDKSFGNVDVEWNLLVNMKINKYLNATLTTALKYDDDVKYINDNGEKKGARVQFKEVLGVGLGYNF